MVRTSKTIPPGVFEPRAMREPPVVPASKRRASAHTSRAGRAWRDPADRGIGVGTGSYGQAAVAAPAPLDGSSRPRNEVIQLVVEVDDDGRHLGQARRCLDGMNDSQTTARPGLERSERVSHAARIGRAAPVGMAAAEQPVLPGVDSRAWPFPRR